MEIWKSIKDFEGYEVSNYGRVRSYIYNNGKWTDTPRLRKLQVSKFGYLTITLNKNKTKKKFFVHVLVANAFLEKINENFEVNHKDGNKLNNNDWNLEWISKSDNIKHAYQNNLLKNGRAKRVKCVDLDLEFDSSYKAAEWLNDYKFGNTRKIKTLSSAIRGVCNGYLGNFKHVDNYFKRKSPRKIAYGFKWVYID